MAVEIKKNQTERLRDVAAPKSVARTLAASQAHFRRSRPRLSGIADKITNYNWQGRHYSEMRIGEASDDSANSQDHPMRDSRL
jgi:hypothetical protein